MARTEASRPVVRRDFFYINHSVISRCPGITIEKVTLAKKRPALGVLNVIAVDRFDKPQTTNRN